MDFAKGLDALTREELNDLDELTLAELTHAQNLISCSSPESPPASAPAAGANGDFDGMLAIPASRSSNAGERAPRPEAIHGQKSLYKPRTEWVNMLGSVQQTQSFRTSSSSLLAAWPVDTNLCAGCTTPGKPRVCFWAFNQQKWRPNEDELDKALLMGCAPGMDITRKKEKDAKSSLAGRVMSKLAIAAMSGTHISNVEIQTTSDLGKPFVKRESSNNKQFHFNYSHDEDWVIMGCTPDNILVGVDVMDTGKTRPYNSCKCSLSGKHGRGRLCPLHGNFFTLAEWENIESGGTTARQQNQLFLIHWCLKESFLKATGCGLATALMWDGQTSNPDSVSFRMTITSASDSEKPLECKDISVLIHGKLVRGWMFQVQFLTPDCVTAVCIGSPSMLCSKSYMDALALRPVQESKAIELANSFTIAPFEVRSNNEVIPPFQGPLEEDMASSASLSEKLQTSLLHIRSLSISTRQQSNPPSHMTSSASRRGSAPMLPPSPGRARVQASNTLETPVGHETRQTSSVRRSLKTASTVDTAVEDAALEDLLGVALEDQFNKSMDAENDDKVWMLSSAPSMSACEGNIVAMSDIHVDFASNRNIIKSMVCGRYKHQVLILAGDVCHDLDRLQDTLRTLRSAFQEVFFVPGNHDLWVVGETSKAITSTDKTDQILEICASLGVHTSPAIVNNTLIIPFQSWYDDTLDIYEKAFPRKKSCASAINAPAEDDSFVDEMWQDYRNCRWPDHLHDNRTAKYTHASDTSEPIINHFLKMNELRLDEFLRKGPDLSQCTGCVTFSHFVPRADLMPERSKLPFNLYKVAGSSKIDNQIRDFKSRLLPENIPHTHVFGHTHIPSNEVREGIRYQQMPLGYPRERRHTGSKEFHWGNVQL